MTCSPSARSRATRSVPSMPCAPVTSHFTRTPLGCRIGRPYPTHVEIRELSVPGAFVMTPKIIGDARGAFLEWFRADRFVEATGHPFTLMQANCSVSAAGTVRGRALRGAAAEPGEVRHLSLAAPWSTWSWTSGSARRRSGSWRWCGSTTRTARRCTSARGSVTPSWRSTTARSSSTSAQRPTHPAASTACTRRTRRSASTGRRRDVTGSRWSRCSPTEDAQAPTLAEAEQAGLLPSYDEALAYVASLRG